MKKILAGFLGLFLVVGIVAGAGYALFTSQVSVTGMVLGTATPSLKISFLDKSDPTWRNYKTDLSFAGQTFAPLLPGEMDWGAFYLKNQSNGTTDQLDFSLKGKITAAAGDWGTLKDVVSMKVCVMDPAMENYCDTTQQTPWYSLADWNVSEKNLPGGTLLQGTERPYVVVFYIDNSLGNSIAGKTITGMTMQVTGTQVL